MSRIAFIFPGQGAQYVGMGKDFYEQVSCSKEVFDLAGEVTGLDMKKLCFEPNEEINITEYTQIAMVAAETAMLRALEEQGIVPEVNAGLSLGEYTALIASGALDEKDAFKLVRKRGIYMQEAVPSGGAMTAVIGLDGETIARVCEKTEGQVSVANYNCPGQTVITGEESAVAAAAEMLKASGARRCVPLTVSGPFHSPMLKSAGEKLWEAMKEIEIQDIRIPYVANVTAEYVSKKEDVKLLLKEQVASSVKWQQSVEKMISDGIDTFIEIGPGRTLNGFLRKIDKNARGFNIEKAEDIKKVAEELKC